MLTCQKDQFSIEPNVHYINGAYMSPLMRSVEAVGLEAVARKSQPYAISPEDFFTNTERLRGAFAQLVNVPKAEQVAIVPSVSYGTGMLARNLKLSPGQTIVLPEAEFPSNVYPWQELAQAAGAKVVMVEMPTEKEGRGRRWNERILEAIDARTALVAIGHVHWATGTLFDLEAIGNAVHAHGGLLVVDGTQSVGALPIDVQRFGIDALICAGYKWLMGPYSLGYAYFHEQFNDFQPLEQNWISRAGSEDFTQLTNYQNHYQPGAKRFDMGERSNFTLVPMGLTAIQQLLAWQPAEIQDYCRRLVQGPVETWRAHGFWIDDEAWRANHLFGLQLPEGADPVALQQRLKAHNIYVSVRGGFVRIAPNVYNDASDLDALTAVLLDGL